MPSSFTLGLKQVKNEFIQMQPSGCYWITADREEDAHRLARQCISTQQSVVLISVGATPLSILTPSPATGPNEIPMFSLPETTSAILSLPDDLSRLMDDRPRLIILVTSGTLWEKITHNNMQGWLKKIQKWQQDKQSALLIVSSGFAITGLRTLLRNAYRQLLGLAQLDWQQDSWQYRTHWWISRHGMMADRTLRLACQQHHFILADSGETYSSLTFNDEPVYLADKQVLEGAPRLSPQWHLFDNNAEVCQHAHHANAATVVLSLQHNEQIPELAEAIHQLRRTRGCALKIVVREMQTSLRISDERLLLACGLNIIVPFNASLSRFLTTLEGVQGQIFHRHVPADLTTLLKSMQPLQERGPLPLSAFCQSVTRLVRHPLLPENGKGLLVALHPVAGLKAGLALTLCKPRRYGDFITTVGQNLYLFLSSCRYNDLDTALQFIFRLPHREIFTSRKIWYEDAAILSEIRQMRRLCPTHLSSHPQRIPITDRPTPTNNHVRRQPEEIILNCLPPDIANEPD